MLMLLFSVLKVIGIIVLIIAIILASLLLVPSFYRLEGNTEGSQATASWNWIGIIRLLVVYETDSFHVFLAVLFIRFDLLDHKKKRNVFLDALLKAIRMFFSLFQRRKKRKKSGKGEQDVAALPEMEPCSEKQGAEEGNISDETVSGDSKRKTHSTFIGSLKKIKQIFRVISEIIKSDVASYFWEKLHKLLIRIRPRRIQGHLQFGLQDPSVTGCLTGLVSVVPFIYQTDFDVVPDFETEKSYVEGDCRMSGHIFGIHILIFMIQMLKSKKIRRLIRTFGQKG